jgi:hypothetical protein
VSSDSIVKGIIDDIIKTAVKTAEVDEQKTKYLQHFINKHDIPLTILSLDTDETVRNLSIEFFVALLCLVVRLFMFLLIFNEQRVPKFTFVLVLTYYVHVLSDQSVHITHTYCCVSKLSKFRSYLYSRVHNNAFLSLRNCFGNRGHFHTILGF